MRHVRVISRHPISIGFRGLTGYQRDPRDLGRHNDPRDLGRHNDPRDLGCQKNAPKTLNVTYLLLDSQNYIMSLQLLIREQWKIEQFPSRKKRQFSL